MLVWNGVIQAIFLFFGGLMLDGGFFAQICFYSGCAFWAAALLIMVRRPLHPTRSDILYFRIGLPLISFADMFILPYLWHLRGVL
ncbi:MAG: hypothetical protein B9S32_05485 [Verrucomicrobia bacterium Tous-C9LFEB]|nr:MAG: hypothetical protein B9S32_05485 [Verrucomicrobia bacterium Tous-C9LFEB]